MSTAPKDPAPSFAPRGLRKRAFEELARLRAAAARMCHKTGSAITNAFHRSAGFFGINGLVAIGILAVATGLLWWLWRYEMFRPYESAAAGGLGVLLAAIIGIFDAERDKVAKWILAISAGLFTIFFAWYTTKDITDQLKEKTEIAESTIERVHLLEDDIVEYVKSLQVNHKEDYERIETSIGFDKLRGRFNDTLNKHKPPFRAVEFDKSRDLIYIIQNLEGYNKNGHALYIEAEIQRILNHPDLGTSQLYAYLELEDGRSRSGKLGAPACRTVEGICRERTAWVFHLLARLLYEQGKRLKTAGNPEATYRQMFFDGLLHARSAIKCFPPNGFSQPPTTRALETNLSTELGNLASKVPNPSGC